MTLYGYARVSVREPEDKNLDLQVERLVRAGCPLGNIRAEEASGAKNDRGGLLELLDLVVEGDTLMVTHIDRLAGNLAEGIRTVQYLHDQGIHIRALPKGLDTGDDSPTSYLQANAAHALVLGRVGEGLHPGPDQGRRGLRRGRRKDGRQAPGAGLREDTSREGLPGRRQVGERGRQKLRGERATIRAVRDWTCTRRTGEANVDRR